MFILYWKDDNFHQTNAEFNAICVTTPSGYSGELDAQTMHCEENTKGLFSDENEGNCDFQLRESSPNQTGPKTQKDTHFTLSM